MGHLKRRLYGQIIFINEDGSSSEFFDVRLEMVTEDSLVKENRQEQRKCSNATKLLQPEESLC